MKAMDMLKNIGCQLIGWDKNILKECSEASHRQFRKLISAICIMMVLWGTIGYCFADRYINIESCILKVCVSLAFMFIVLCVERVIILTVGKARLMTVMRVMLALCMAVLGSCIFDQIIFRNDIKQTIQDHREDVIKETITKRMSIFEKDERRIKTGAGTDENGNPIFQTSTTVNKKKMPNPMAGQLNANNEQIQLYQNQLEQIRQDKKDISKTVTEEVHSRPVGFIEELEATLKVVSNSWISLVFYLILFCFLTFLELFVLTIKMGESKCDYELIVEHQLNLKRNLMEHTERTFLS